MRIILSISYSDLPRYLKPCMLYLSSYPEDTVIIVQDLIWKWVAEGFIIPNNLGRSIIEVGEDYVDELISRSMIQPEYSNHDSDKATHCRVHDMVLDAITRLSKEEDFLTILHGQQPTYLPERTIRRLFLQICNEEDIKQLLNVGFSHVRSLTVSPKPFNLLPTPLTLPVLRVLDLSRCEKVNNHYFKDICNMLHLRSLRLCYTDINKIPKEIGKLKLLQVLDMVGTRVQKLPSTFIQLRELLYLRVNSLKELPDGFGNLKYLQELHGTITMDSSTMMHNLVGLTDLKRLDLLFNEWDTSYEKLFLRCLSSLVSLEYIKLAGSNGEIGSRCEELTPGPEMLQNINMASSTIHAVPRWMSSLSTLSILYISLITMGEEDLHVLGSIPSLSHLQLSVEEPTQGRDKRLVINNAKPFSCLTKFEIYNVTGVVFMKGAMPKLKTLFLTFGVLETLGLFGDFDFGLENLSSLVHVDAFMGCVRDKSEKAMDAEDAIRNVLNINPNKPTLNAMKTHSLKVHIHCEGCQTNIMKILSEIDSVSEENIQLKQGKLTVSGQVDPTTVIDKLNKAGMLAQLLSYRWEQPWYLQQYPNYPDYIHSAEEDPNGCSVM
ncbi:unnamed protein product [Urochloa decumbens]|uniref:HMA domain-containing protein n=1 Tax=Urochloa decumbens TaxID=240449 RepID=A0ABC9B6E5_9POAL